MDPVIIVTLAVYVIGLTLGILCAKCIAASIVLVIFPLAVMLLYTAANMRDSIPLRCLLVCTCSEAEEPAVMGLLREPAAYAASAALTIYSIDDIIKRIMHVESMSGDTRMQTALVVGLAVFILALLIRLAREVLDKRRSKECDYVASSSLKTLVVAGEADVSHDAVRRARLTCCNRGQAERIRLLLLSTWALALGAAAYLSGLMLTNAIGHNVAPLVSLLAALSVLIARSWLLKWTATLLASHRPGSIYLVPKDPGPGSVVASPYEYGDSKDYENLAYSLERALWATGAPLAVFIDSMLPGIVGFILGHMMRITRRSVGVAQPVAVYNLKANLSSPEYIMGPISDIVDCCPKPRSRSVSSTKYIVVIGLYQLDSGAVSISAPSLEKDTSISVEDHDGRNRYRKVSEAVARLLVEKLGSDAQKNSPFADSHSAGSGNRLRLAVLAQASPGPKVLSQGDIRQLRGYGVTHLLWISVMKEDGSVLQGEEHKIVAEILSSALVATSEQLARRGAQLQAIIPAMSPLTGIAFGHRAVLASYRFACGYSLRDSRYSCWRPR